MCARRAPRDCPQRSVTYTHAMRNAVIPLITMIALDLPTDVRRRALYRNDLFLAGHGASLLGSGAGRDYPVLLGVIMINAVLIVVANIVADMLYGVADPRVRYE